MRGFLTKLLAIVFVFTFLILTGCSEKASNAAETSEPAEQEETERVKVLPTCSETKMNIYRAILQETGFDPVIESTFDPEQNVYTDVKLNPYYAAGFKYYIMTEEEYNDILEYQNETGIQVMYPSVKFQDRPKSAQYKNDANIYYKIDASASGSIAPLLDDNGDFIPNYWAYAVDSDVSALIAAYDSIRIEGETGVDIDGVNYHYAYARKVSDGIEVRVFYYEYVKYRAYKNPDINVSDDIQFRTN